ncbi:MAG: hypothetical protein J6Z25_02900 [Opitutales bacterium]|nr:hypothetical protein [Opitutales bacterium]
MTTSAFSSEQIEQIRNWMPKLHSIGELQTKINETFRIHLTYLETRFLMDDWDLQFAPEPVKSEPKTTASSLDPMEGEVVEEGLVRVSVDPVMRPGMVTNGSVTFSDGKTATWGLDRFGRLSLQPTQPGYRPSQEDLVQFQAALQEKLSQNAGRGLGL